MKKIISLILAVLMLLSVVPMQIFAAGEPILESVEVVDTTPISYKHIQTQGSSYYVGMDTDSLYDISDEYSYNYKLYFANGQVLNTADNIYGDELAPYGLTGYYVETLFSRKACQEAIEKGYPTVKVTVKVNLYKLSGEYEYKEFEVDRAITESIVKSINLIGDIPDCFDNYNFRESLYDRDFEIEYFDGRKETLTFKEYLGSYYINSLYQEGKEEIDPATGNAVYYRDVQMYFIDGVYCVASEKIDRVFKKIDIIDYKFDSNINLKSIKYKVTYQDGRTVVKNESFDVAVGISGEEIIGAVDGYPIYALLNVEETDYTLELSAGYEVWNVHDIAEGETRDICKCICHKNGILYLIGFFVIAFWRALSLYTYCDCGNRHY